MAQTTIEWTATYKPDGTVLPGFTFNPWLGCTRVSPGCVNCYAETMMDKRYGKVKWGSQGTRIRTSADYWKQPLKWNREAAADGIRRRVFCASLADVFEYKPDQDIDMDSWRTQLFSLIRMTPHLDWLILTKRLENVALLTPWFIDRIDEYPNVWIGTSVENQEYADKRIPELLKIPAAVRFLSVEPMLGPVDLSAYLTPQWTSEERLSPKHGIGFPPTFDVARIRPRVDWVIVGGESGHGARPMHPQWAHDIRDQCQEAGVPFFFKQMGEYGATAFDMMEAQPVFRAFPNELKWAQKARTWLSHGDICVDLNGRVLTNGADFAAAAYPVVALRKVGKHRAGRLLDGREWNEFPQMK